MCIRDRSKSDTLSNSSDNENIIGVEVSDEVIISVNELEREWRESLSEYGGSKGQIFPMV